MRVEHSDLGRLGILRLEVMEEWLEGRTSILGLAPRAPYPPRTADTINIGHSNP